MKDGEEAEPSYQQYIAQYLAHSTERYVTGLQRSGFVPSETLIKAIAQRVVNEANESYLQHITERHHQRIARLLIDYQQHIHDLTEQRDQRIAQVLSDHRQRMNHLKRSGMHLRSKTCPPLALLFGFLAWYNFTYGTWLLGIFFSVGACAFLAMLLFGWLFGRPT